jgi:hypothetical protein
MSILRTSLIAAAVTGAALVPSAAAQGATTTLATEQAATRVAAWEGTILWSRLDPATNRYQLVKSVGGAPAVPVAVAQRDGAFDVDLGTSRTGSTVAVYTRGGDIYRLNVATGAETKVDRLNSPRLAERSPSIQRGEIAFIRREAGRDQLRIGNTTGASKASRLIVKKRSIVGAELGDRHVAYVESVTFSDVGGEARVHVRNLRTGADKVVYRARSGGANFADVTRPTYVAGPEGFLWARTNMGSGEGNRIVRYTLRGSSLAYAPGSPFYVSTGWAGDTLGAVTTSALAQTGCDDGPSNPRPYCTVELTGPLTFGPRP